MFAGHVTTGVIVKRLINLLMFGIYVSVPSYTLLLFI